MEREYTVGQYGAFLKENGKAIVRTKDE